MIFRRKNKGNVENEILSLKKKATELIKYGQGKLQDLMDTYDQLSKIIRENYGENHPDYANSLFTMATIYSLLGYHSKAMPLYEKTLDIRYKTLGENHQDYVRALVSLATVYQYLGDYGKAEHFGQKALEISRRVFGENHQDYIAALMSSSTMYVYLGDYGKAEHFGQKALEISRRVLGENHLYYAICLNNLAEVYRNMGDYGKAEPLYQKALEISRRVLGEKPPYYTYYLNNFALMYSAMGDFTKAIHLFQKALEISRRVFGENHPDYAKFLNNLAVAYQYMGDHDKAKPLYEKVLGIIAKEYGKNHPYYTATFSSLAAVYRNTGDYGKAESMYENVLESQHRTLGENHPDYASNLHNLGFIYQDIGDYGKAEPLHEKALDIRRRVLGENHPHYADSLNILALLYAATSSQTKAFHALQEYVAAEDKLVDQIFSIASERQRISFIDLIQNRLSIFLSFVFQQFSQDQQAIQNALDLVIRRKSLAAEAITVQRELFLAGKYPQLKSTLFELNKIRREHSQMSLAGPSPDETLDKYKQSLEELDSKKEQLETELARNIPEIQLQYHLKMLNFRILSNSLPEGVALIEFVRFYNYNFNAIRSRGDPQFHSPRYLAFILKSKESENVRMIDLGDATFIDKAVTSFRTSMIEEGSAKETQHLGYESPLVTLGTVNSSYQNDSWKDIGYELYKLIFYPLLSAIGDCKNLFLAPDGDLSRLPFEVLPTCRETRTHFLIDDYSIRYLATARDILRINKLTDGSSNESIVAADPDFDLDGCHSPGSNIMNKSTYSNSDSADEIIIGMPVGKRSPDFAHRTINFDRLVGTDKEGKEISKLLGVQPWMGEEVLESRLKSYKSPKILHIATHGFFLENQQHDPSRYRGNTLIGIIKGGDANVNASSTNVFNRLSGQDLENPMLRSGLALAGANTWIQNKPLRQEAEDGILTAEDVSGMELSNTELVVLSACETGLGDILTGEGVFGLRRSFILGGARTLVMSLWKVPDKQTKELMIDFYRRLLSGEPRAEALREAQLAMKEKYPNPYFWGAFICQGNPGPILNRN